MKRILIISLLLIFLLFGCSNEIETTKTFRNENTQNDATSTTQIDELIVDINSEELITETEKSSITVKSKSNRTKASVSITEAVTEESTIKVKNIEKSTTKNIKKAKSTTAEIIKQEITKKSRRFVTTTKSTTESDDTADQVSETIENNSNILLTSKSTQISTTKQTTTPVTTTIQKETISVTVKCNCKNAIDYGFSSDTIPQNGEIFQESVLVEQGTSALDAIIIACRQSGTSITEKRGYISEIGGLKEKDCDGLGGWLYKVNGELPNNSSDKYKLNDGDVIELIYTVKIGDVT